MHRTWTFPWGGISLEPAPIDIATLTVRPTQWQIVCGGAALKATMKRPLAAEARPAFADAIGRAISHRDVFSSDVPFSHAILIALAIIAVHNRIPSLLDVRLAQDISRLLDWSPAATSVESARLRDLRRMIDDAPMASIGTLIDQAQEFGASAWDRARAMLLLCEAAWKRLGDRDAARCMGRTSITLSPTQRLMASVLALSWVPPSRWPPAPAPIADGAHASEIWMDWAAVAAGPAPPDAALWTRGMGAPFSHPIHESQSKDRAMLWEDVERIAGVADALLADRQRPLPRLIGKLVRIPLPTHLLPVWKSWDISSLAAQIHAEGMYLSLRSHADDAVSVVWWDADPSSVSKTPLTMPPAAWVLTHATAAAIWHDLCAEAIIVTDPAHPAISSAHERGHRSPPQSAMPKHQRQNRRKSMLLPPRRAAYAAGTWGDAAEHDQICAAIARSAHYRRLPTGWHEREDQRVVIARRRAAADRAQRSGFPAPPPGYTFVRATSVVGGSSTESNVPPRTLRCQGLLALSLLVRETETVLQEAGMEPPASQASPPFRRARR